MQKARKIAHQATAPLYQKNNSSSISKKISSTFLFDTTGAKRKVHKRETPRIISPSAEGDKGSAPLTAPPFEKGGRKLSCVGLC